MLFNVANPEPIPHNIAINNNQKFMVRIACRRFILQGYSIESSSVENFSESIVDSSINRVLSLGGVCGNLNESSCWALVAVPRGEARRRSSTTNVRRRAQNGKVNTFSKIIKIKRYAATIKAIAEKRFKCFLLSPLFV